MHSPDPVSPSDSTSSGSPPPEEAIYSSSNAGYFSNLTSQITNTFARTAAGVGGSSSKRRLPGSSFASGPDPKARKKTGDAGRGNSQYEGGPTISTKKDKEELVDTGTVDWLRKEVGDPFFEPGVRF